MDLQGQVAMVTGGASGIGGGTVLGPGGGRSCSERPRPEGACCAATARRVGWRILSFKKRNNSLVRCSLGRCRQPSPTGSQTARGSIIVSRSVG
jgi:hypothetical protein